MELRLSKLTDVGRVRDGNEDSVAIVASDDPRCSLLIVADGMGGAAAGEVASATAVSVVGAAFESGARSSDELVEALQKANASILDKGSSDGELEGLGTTCTALLLHEDSGIIAHAGDSRAYRFRDCVAERLTDDESEWADNVCNGASPAAEHGRNHLSNVLGIPEVEIASLGPFDLRVGDRFLLCSDGLWGYLADFELADLVCRGDLDEVCRRLVDVANQRGGADNITVAVAEVL